MLDLLELPQRSPKPRQDGITHVLDRGLSVDQVDGLVEVTGGAVDIVKLGWGTPVVTGNLQRKVARYHELEIPVVFGGTLTELAIAQGRLDALLDVLRELRLRHIEISDGTITLAHEEKLDLIERLSAEFTVLSEVGSKDDTRIMAPYRWVELIERELEAGAWKVIAEARESGTSGIFRHDGEVRMGLIDEIVHQIPPEQMIFEAPRKDQQVWFVRRLGANVNLGNVSPEDVLSLETIRCGLRADTAIDYVNAPPGSGRLALAEGERVPRAGGPRTASEAATGGSQREFRAARAGDAD
jgi:phosphosulfolactate synthase